MTDLVATFQGAANQVIGDVHIPQAAGYQQHTTEEVGEMAEAFRQFQVQPTPSNAVRVADAACDAIYCAIGLLNSIGVDANHAFALVHKANMNKANAEGRFETTAFGKIKKPAGWEAPDLSAALLECWK
jgi:predicted HAD superfamily Cof-like phosphohydrolase